ncbi:MAG: peptidylprolyl isomerase [Elusimicrobia bacterium]|nr:peptidylprolyl isomerase [Candidatus Liberimonas magnetica]
MKYFCFLLSFVFVLGCAKAGDKKVVMNVGKDKTTLEMLKRRFKEAPPTLQGYINSSAGRKQFMDLLLRERLVIESAKELGYAKKKEYVEGIANYKKEQAKAFKEYQENLLVELFVKDLHSNQISPSNEEVMKYYEDHKNEYDKPLEIKARHILLASKEEAQKVLDRLKAGEDFAKLAKEVSIDPISANRGGEIGPFKKGDLIPEFEKAVFPLKKGEVSDIVETQFGLHIIKKENEKTLAARPIEEAREEIKRLLEKRKFDAWIETAKEKNKVKVDYDAVSKIPFENSEQQQISQKEAKNK